MGAALGDEVFRWCVERMVYGQDGPSPKCKVGPKGKVGPEGKVGPCGTFFGQPATGGFFCGVF